MKNEVYRVAGRYGLKVFVVANSFLNVPRDPLVERVVVNDSFDAADNWIADRAGEGDVQLRVLVTVATPRAQHLQHLRDERDGGQRPGHQAERGDGFRAHAAPPKRPAPPLPRRGEGGAGTLTVDARTSARTDASLSTRHSMHSLLML